MARNLNQQAALHKLSMNKTEVPFLSISSVVGNRTQHG